MAWYAPYWTDFLFCTGLLGAALLFSWVLLTIIVIVTPAGEIIFGPPPEGGIFGSIKFYFRKSVLPFIILGMISILLSSCVVLAGTEVAAVRASINSRK